MFFRISGYWIQRRLNDDTWANVARIEDPADTKILVSQANVYKHVEELVDKHLGAMREKPRRYVEASDEPET